jgi:hypothetical protein
MSGVYQSTRLTVASPAPPSHGPGIPSWMHNEEILPSPSPQPIVRPIRRGGIAPGTGEQDLRFKFFLGDLMIEGHPAHLGALRPCVRVHS